MPVEANRHDLGGQAGQANAKQFERNKWPEHSHKDSQDQAWPQEHSCIAYKSVQQAANKHSSQELETGTSQSRQRQLVSQGTVQNTMQLDDSHSRQTAHIARPGLGQQSPAHHDKLPATKRARSSENDQGQNPQQKGTAASKGKHGSKTAAKSLLSFCEELEEDEGSTFSLAETTRHKFKKERRIDDLNPALSYSLPTASKHMMLGSNHMRNTAGNKSLGHLCFGAATTIGARPYMEDRHTVVASFSPMSNDISRSFAGVYDGHNGAKAAEHCSSRLHIILASNPALRSCTGSGATNQAEEQSMKVALQHAFHSVDQEILQSSRRHDAQDGSTGLVLLRVGEILYMAHCGDSRAVLSRAGQAVQLTKDHKPNLPAESKRIREAGGRIDFSNCWRVIVEPKEGRPGSGLAVSRSFGDLAFKEPCRLVECEPDVGQWPLQEADSFAVMASDGLWDVMSDQEAVDHVQKSLTSCQASAAGRRSTDRDARSAAETLVAEAVKRGTLDNVTVIVCLLPWH